MASVPRFERGGNDFTPPPDPDVRWCGDLTEIPTGEGKLYLLAVILDLHSRRCIGFATDTHHDAALARAALCMAIAIRGGSVAGWCSRVGEVVECAVWALVGLEVAGVRSVTSHLRSVSPARATCTARMRCTAAGRKPGTPIATRMTRAAMLRVTAAGPLTPAAEVAGDLCPARERVPERPPLRSPLGWMPARPAIGVLEPVH
jgi:hypothetical protein